MTAAAVLVLVMLCFPIILFTTYAFAALKTVLAMFVAIVIGLGFNTFWVFIVGTMTPEGYDLELPYHLLLFTVSFSGSMVTGLLLRWCRSIDERGAQLRSVAKTA